MGDATLTTPVTDALRRLRRASGVSLAFGGVVTEATGLQLRHFVGRTTGALTGLAVDAGQGLGGKVLAIGQPVVVRDYRETTTITHHYNGPVETEGLRAMAAAPVIVDRRVVAVLYGALHCDNAIGGRMLDILTGEARALEQQIVVSRAVVEAQARASPDIDLMRDRMAAAYGRLRLLARAVDDAALAGELERITEGLLAHEGGVADRLPVTLTGRECDVLALVSLGYTNARIGAELGVAAETAKGYVKTAMGKLGASTRLEAVVLARRGGLLPG